MNKRKLQSQFTCQIEDRIYITKFNIYNNMSVINDIMNSMSVLIWSTDRYIISKTNVEDCLK